MDKGHSSQLIHLPHRPSVNHTGDSRNTVLWNLVNFTHWKHLERHLFRCFEGASQASQTEGPSQSLQSYLEKGLTRSGNLVQGIPVRKSRGSSLHPLLLSSQAFRKHLSTFGPHFSDHSWLGGVVRAHETVGGTWGNPKFESVNEQGSCYFL
jgi:hypothetical protein